MKKSFRIGFMALATMMLLLLSVVPHHHHQGLWCTIVETCAIDHDDNDEHTHHHDDSTSCVEHLNYVVTKHSVAQNNTQIQHHQFVAILAVIAQCIAPNSMELESVFVELDEFYSGVDISNCHSLRAPPVA